MGLINSTLLSGATISASGGTAKTFTEDGLMVANGKHLIDASVTDYKTRPTMTAKVKQPVYNKSTKGFSKGKKEIAIAVPIVAVSGEMVYPLIRFTLEDHPDMTDAQYNTLLSYGAQLGFDTDFTAFFKQGSLG